MAKFLDLEGLNYFWAKIKSWVLERFAYKSDLNQKLDKLRSGQNIKTINNLDILGPGNIESGEENIIESISVNGTQLTITNKNVDIAVPTKTSDLNNDSGFITGYTETDPTVPSWAKQPNKPSYDYSEIGNTPDLRCFITKSVNDLTNYYLKSETYTKAEVAALIGAIQQFHYEIYPTLPQSGESNILYLVGPTGSGSDKYEEYVYSNNAFTKIGDTSIDLSGYVTTSALNTALASYATTQDLEDVVDDSKVFWAEVDVTTFSEIKDAVDAGRTVMLKDEDNFVYFISHIEDYYVSFSSVSGEESLIRYYNVYDDDSYKLFEITQIESQNNRVTSISSSSEDYHYPSARAVYQALQSYTPTSNLATVATSGDYDDLTNKPTIPTVHVQDVTVGGTSVVSNGTAVIPQEVFWAEYGVTTYNDVKAAWNEGKICLVLYGVSTTLSGRLCVLTNIGDYCNFYSTFGSIHYVIRVSSSNVWSMSQYVYENTASKVSTISGNETNTTKYPNTKAVADALGKWGVISQTQTWSGTGTQPRTYVMRDLVYGTIPQANIDLFGRMGASFNETSGYFEFGELNDISYQEMISIYMSYSTSKHVSVSGGMDLRSLSTIRTTCTMSNTSTVSLHNSFIACSFENIYINNYFTTDNIASAFRGCYRLKNACLNAGQINIPNLTTQSNADRAFRKCYSLENVRLTKLKVNISFSDCSKLNLDSVVHIVQEADNTSAITITLHADALARCTADTTEYEYNGSTYTGIVALATAKNITLASA